jgi:hypothetical protein
MPAPWSEGRPDLRAVLIAETNEPAVQQCLRQRGASLWRGKRPDRRGDDRATVTTVEEVCPSPKLRVRVVRDEPQKVRGRNRVTGNLSAQSRPLAPRGPPPRIAIAGDIPRVAADTNSLHRGGRRKYPAGTRSGAGRQNDASPGGAADEARSHVCLGRGEQILAVGVG